MLSVLHQFNHFPVKYVCGPGCFKNSASQSGRKFSEPESNNASSSSPYKLTVFDYFNVLVFFGILIFLHFV